jgi:hypothetical protein
MSVDGSAAPGPEDDGRPSGPCTLQVTRAHGRRNRPYAGRTKHRNRRPRAEDQVAPDQGRALAGEGEHNTGDELPSHNSNAGLVPEEGT